jgi:hypothetical protein
MPFFAAAGEPVGARLEAKDERSFCSLGMAGDIGARHPECAGEHGVHATTAALLVAAMGA